MTTAEEERDIDKDCHARDVVACFFAKIYVGDDKGGGVHPQSCAGQTDAVTGERARRRMTTMDEGRRRREPR